MGRPKKTTGTPLSQIVTPQLLTSDEAEAIVQSMTTGRFVPGDVGRAIAWCNQVRINERLVDSVIEGAMRITHFVSGEPVFEMVEPEKKIETTVHVAQSASETSDSDTQET